MAETRFIARPALGGYAQSFGAVRLEEVTGLGLAALAIPQGGAAAVDDALREALGLGLPEPGWSVRGEGGRRLVRTAPDQLLALMPGARADFHLALAGEIEGLAWVTEQSDAWVALRLSGEPAVLRDCLARLVMLDLHPDAFPPGRAVRTRMEHLAGLLIREEEPPAAAEDAAASDSFLLLSARSSAESFLHAVEVSIVNVV